MGQTETTPVCNVIVNGRRCQLFSQNGRRLVLRNRSVSIHAIARVFKTALERTCHGTSAIAAQSPIPGSAIDGPLVCPWVKFQRETLSRCPLRIHWPPAITGDLSLSLSLSLSLARPQARGIPASLSICCNCRKRSPPAGYARIPNDFYRRNDRALRIRGVVACARARTRLFVRSLAYTRTRNKRDRPKQTCSTLLLE